jgi:hypothetical protein
VQGPQRFKSSTLNPESNTPCAFEFISPGAGSSSTKMKDWDKAVESDDVIDEAMSGSESEGLGDW